MAVFALSPRVALAHCADQFAGLEVVGGEGRIGGVDRIERRVERDDQQAGLARLLDGRHDRLGSLGVIRMPLAPAEISSRWPRPGFVVAVVLAGEGLQGDAQFLGLRRGAFPHLDEERVGVGLGDEADDQAVGMPALR